MRAILSVNNSLSLFYPVSRLNYGEPSNADALYPDRSLGAPYYDTENGWLHGVGGAITGMDSEEKLYIHGSYQLVTGPVSYVGACGSPGNLSACQGTSDARIGDGAFRLGKGFIAGEHVMLTPYAELGYHFWQRNLGPQQPQENYQHHTWSVGGMLQYAPFAPHTSGMGTVITADLSVGKIYDSRINVPGELANAPLGQKPIIQMGVDIDWLLTSALSFFTGFHYTYFSYGQSPVQNAAMEPISYTQFYTLSAGARLSFANLMKPR